VALLGQVEAGGIALDIHPQEEAKLDEVFDYKLPAKAFNDLLLQRRARYGEHDVVDVEEKIGDVVAAAENGQG